MGCYKVKLRYIRKKWYLMIRRNHQYYIDEFKTMNEFIKEFLIIIKDKKIKSFISIDSLCWTENRSFADKVYDTDGDNYLIFDDDTILKFSYNFFSMIYVELTDVNSLNVKDAKAINLSKNNQFEFDCYGEAIVDYELNNFSDEYIIDPSYDTTRPEGGDYFKEIIFHLSNKKKLCICAENAEVDGYCNIWMENNDSYGVFNGEVHKTWWS